MSVSCAQRSARDNNQQVVSITWFSATWSFEGDREEILATSTYSDGGAAKMGNQETILDLDVKNVSWPIVVDHKHHITTSTNWYCKLVSGVHNAYEYVTWVHNVT